MTWLCQNFLLRPLQCHGLGHARILELPVKLRHEVRGGLVINEPEARESAACPRLYRNTGQS